jgi:hypothetical protein
MDRSRVADEEMVIAFIDVSSLATTILMSGKKLVRLGAMVAPNLVTSARLGLSGYSGSVH